MCVPFDPPAGTDKKATAGPENLVRKGAFHPPESRCLHLSGRRAARCPIARM